MVRRCGLAQTVAAIGALSVGPFGMARAGLASVISWKGAAGASFGAGSNWNGNVAPVSGDTALFNIPATPIFDTSPTTGNLSIVGNAVTFQASGAAQTYTVAGAAGITGGTLSLATSTVSFLLQSASVNVFSTSSLIVNASTHAAMTTLNIATDATGAGGVTITGSAASLVVSGLTTLGNNGGSATLTLQNNATGSFAAVDVGGAASTAAGAHLVIFSGAQATVTGNVAIGAAGASGAGYTLLVSGAGSSFTQSGNAAVTVGQSLGGNSAVLTVSNGGVFSSGTKPAGTASVSILGTGTLNIDSGSVFNSHGDFLVDGGTVTRDQFGTFNQDTGSAFTAAHGAHVTFNGNYDIFHGTVFRVQSGASFSASSYVDIGDGSAATLLVDGTGSTFACASAPWWGAHGAAATITVSNAASCTIHSSLTIAATGADGTTTTASVQSGGSLTVDDLFISTEDGNASGALTVTGANSVVSQTSGGDFNIGATLGTATLSVNAGGTFNSGGGTTTLNPTGTITLAGGTYNANGPVVFNGGQWYVNSGTLNLNTGAALTASDSVSLFVGQASGAAAVLKVNTGANLTTADFVVNPTGAININGGTYDANGLLILKAGAKLTFAGSANNYSGQLVLNPATLYAGLIVLNANDIDKQANLLTLSNEIRSGSNGGLWTGNGITSAAAASQPGMYGVGIFDLALIAAPVIPNNPVTLDSHSILIGTALLGDTNLDNHVDALDLSRIAANWNSHSATNWAMGDLNDDGVVDSLDVAIVLSHWTAGAFTPQVSYSVGFSYTLVAVPEPAGLAIIAIAGPLLLRRRRAYSRRTALALKG